MRGVVETVKPCAIIAIDSLAARSLGRIASSMQVSDTGISPGSGLGTGARASTGNGWRARRRHRRPMVVYAATIVHDTVGQVLST